MLKRLRAILATALDKLEACRDAHYTSVPVWKPWRDF